LIFILIVISNSYPEKYCARNKNILNKSNLSITENDSSLVALKPKIQNDSIIEKDSTQQNETEIFIDPESIPEYKYGGNGELLKFIKENLKYPNEQCLAGKVFVEFTVDTLGQVRDVVIKKGLTKEANEEAIRITKMLEFKPGSFYGKLVEKRMIIPIDFNIQK